MKQFKTAARLVVVGLALFAISFHAQAVTKGGNAVVRAVRGTAKYSSGGGVWVPLKVGTSLQSGSSVQTGPESTVDLFLGKNGPVVRVTPDTTIAFDKLAFTDTGADTVIDTQLNLKSGRILGNVKKLASSSRYEIKTPNGVAGIRGTDFDVTVTALGGGRYDIVVTSVSGTIVGAVVLDNAPYTAVINTGETWHPLNPNDQPTAVDPALLASLREQILDLINSSGIPEAGGPKLAPLFPPVHNNSPASPVGLQNGGGNGDNGGNGP